MFGDPHDHRADTPDLYEADPLDLDDQRDAEELRHRYGFLLQEVRVLLPGTQVLVAFLLTAPFAARFAELDATGRNVYVAATILGLVSLVAFVTPTAFHRFGDRRSRSQRLHWGVRSVQVGLVFLGLALLAALFVVTRLVLEEAAAIVIVVAIGAAMVGAWLVLPELVARRPDVRSD